MNRRGQTELLQELVAIGIALAAERDMASLLEAIVRHARCLTRADGGMLFLREGEDLRLMVAQNALEASDLVAEAVSTGRLVNRGPLLAVPLQDRTGEVLGVLALVNGRDDDELVAPFDPCYEPLVASLATQAAAALHNARSYGEAQERLRTTATLFAVAQVLSHQAPVEEMLRRVGREIAQALGADTVGSYSLDARKEALVPIAGYRLPKDLLPTFRRMSLVLARWPGLQEAMRDRRAIWSSDAGNDPRFDRETLAELPGHSTLFAPTVARGEAVGGIYIAWWRTGREFLPAEVRLIEGVATQVGLALENVDLGRQTETKLKETETLLAVSRALSSTLDIGMLMRHFLRRLASVIDADGVGSYMLDEDGESLVPLQGYRLPSDRLDVLRGLRLSIVRHALYAEGARTKRPVFSPDAMNDPRIPEVWREAAPHKSELFIPIVAKDRVIGALIAAWWDRVREFSESEMVLIEAIASQAGVALENARLFHENSRQIKELSALHALSRAITGELDRKTLIEALYTQMAHVFEVGDVLIALRTGTEGEVEVALRIRDGVRDSTVPWRLPVTSAGLLSVVMTAGAPLRTDDHAAECARRGVGSISDWPSTRYWLGVPMTAASDALGVIALARGERAFTDSDEHLLANIAQLAALELRSARLFEERETAYTELTAAQDQLVRTEKLRAMGEMASGVAHDFNNVLAAILGRAQLLMSNLQDPRLRRWAEIIDQAAQDGAQTVRRLQEFTRVRRDEPVVPFDLNEIVRGALDMTQSRWRDEPASRNIAISVQTALAPIAPIAGDPAELREALTNLILNALDAMPDGGVLTLATRVVGDAVELTVSDTGTGIPESVRQRIFDPFFTTKGPRGTGLGLSMTYGIVVRHDGHIAVESEPGRGTRFRLTFPIRNVRVATRDTPTIDGPSRVAPRRCLVVDDEEYVASMLADVLLSAGHTAVVVTDPVAALTRLEAERFDVVFTDLAMPGMSGWQVARAVKARRPESAVLLITGYGVELSSEECQRLGVDAVLAKPVGVDAILDALVRIAARPL